MKEQQISKAYAKAVLELGEKASVAVADELTTFNEAINSCDQFEILLFSEVFSLEEKQSVTTAIFEKLNLSNLVKNFIFFLLQENRIGIFPLVYKEIIVIDDDKKGFLRGVVEGSDDAINEEFKKSILAYLKEKMGKETELSYIQNAKITAGYKVTVEDLQLDASIDNQLSRFKETIISQ